MTPGEQLDVAAVTSFALFAVLGLAVARRPLGWWDARAVLFRGQATQLALLFTISGRSKALTLGYAAAVAIFAAARWPIAVPLLLAASQLISQMIVEGLKAAYRRTRPDYWLVGLEAGHSFPSGHATTAIVSFAGWAVVAASSGFPPYARGLLAAFFALWAIGVCWSRLALGAHYLSDVIGGALLGGAWLCALFATVPVLLHA